jgi:hypothetical protein
MKKQKVQWAKPNRATRTPKGWKGEGKGKGKKIVIVATKE